jgi:hypothetical protein
VIWFALALIVLCVAVAVPAIIIGQIVQWIFDTLNETPD